MDEQLLSSEEIRELTKGANNSYEITKEEIDALGEIGNISIGTSATTLYSLLQNKVVITTPNVSVTSIKSLKEKHPIPFLSVEVSYTEGLDGSNLMIIKEEDAKIIADLMMGGDGTNIDMELDELRMSAVAEAMNQMMGSAATSLSTLLKKDINISPPILNRVNFADDSPESLFDENDEMVITSFRMEVGDILKSEIMQLMPISFAKTLVEYLYGLSTPNDKVEDTVDISTQGPNNDFYDDVEKIRMVSSADQEPIKPVQESHRKVMATPVQFETFEQEPISVQSSSIDLILDVSLEVTVELGRTNKTIKEILDFSHGTIIELDKMAGEPVDILVNGKFIAKGEVVVIDEDFGVRITEIINSMDRVKSLQ